MRNLRCSSKAFASRYFCVEVIKGVAYGLGEIFVVVINARFHHYWLLMKVRKRISLMFFDPKLNLID